MANPEDNPFNTFSGKGDLVNKVSQAKTGGNVQQQFAEHQFDPSSVLGSFEPIPAISAGSFSFGDPPAETQALEAQVEELTRKFANRGPRMGKKFRNRALSNLESIAGKANEKSAEFSDDLLESRGFDPSKEKKLVSFLSAERSKATKRSLSRAKDEMLLANGLSRFKNRQTGLGMMLDVMASKRGLEQQAAALQQQTNQALGQLQLRSQLLGEQATSKLNLEASNLMAQRDRILQNLYQQRQEIIARQKRAKGGFFGGLLGGALKLGIGAATGGVLGAGLLASGAGDSISSGFGLLGGD